MIKIYSELSQTNDTSLNCRGKSSTRPLFSPLLKKYVIFIFLHIWTSASLSLSFFLFFFFVNVTFKWSRQTWTLMKVFCCVVSWSHSSRSLHKRGWDWTSEHWEEKKKKKAWHRLLFHLKYVCLKKKEEFSSTVTLCVFSGAGMPAVSAAKWTEGKKIWQEEEEKWHFFPTLTRVSQSCLETLSYAAAERQNLPVTHYQCLCYASVEHMLNVSL